MSQKNWLGFLLKMAAILLEALMDYLRDDNQPEEKKTTPVGG